MNYSLLSKEVIYCTIHGMWKTEVLRYVFDMTFFVCLDLISHSTQYIIITLEENSDS